MQKLFLQALVAGLGLAIGFAVVWAIADPIIAARRVDAMQAAMAKAQAANEAARQASADAHPLPKATELPMVGQPATPVIQPRSVEDRYGGDVQRMLDQADAYRKHGIESSEDRGRNLVAPEGANAVDLYRKVLAMQPANVQAKQGLHDIAAFFTTFAQQACSRRTFEACQLNAENGLRAVPDDATLRQLAAQADQAMRASGG